MRFLEITFKGWTATPRMPFILTGNSICMSVPSYSTILGIIGCCLGRVVTKDEVNIGFYYQYQSTGLDIETRQRLEYDGKRIKAHSKGTDAYSREFHVMPLLKIWVDKLDWKDIFKNPIGTPSLGRSQDILEIKEVREIEAEPVESCGISGCMLPFNPQLQVSGQLVQLAEAFVENYEIGSGRTAINSKTFIAIPHNKTKSQKIKFRNLFQIIKSEKEECEISYLDDIRNLPSQFYLHKWD